ncbi:LD-carboxypeptidase [Candidatus Sumerlaeota bacterium]|nr:LD-carboxypeptidase [Candidatus Sumerlaeota bacterium]
MVSRDPYSDAPIRPAGLRSGDTVAVLAPASQIKPGQEEARAKGRAWLEAHDLIPKMMTHSETRHPRLPFLAGEDEARLADLHEAFADPEVRAVWCMRGGWGSPRLLADLDFDLIAAHPKVFIGFSDITGLHSVLNQRLGWVTFHGPMISANLGTKTWQGSDWAVESLLRCVMARRGAPGPISQGRPEFMGSTLVEGVARGVTIGGNLSLVGSLLGTPFGLDDTPGRILVLEEVGEAPYRIDRLLTQLRLALKLESVAGIALGQFTGLDEDDERVLRAVFEDRLGDLGKPVVMGLPFGHEDPAACVPLGAPARLEARSDGTGDLIFPEPVTS